MCPVIAPQNTDNVPNAILIPRVITETKIVEGKLVTSCDIVISDAYVDNVGDANETWVAGPKMTTYHIDDLKNLAANIDEHQTQATQAYYAVLGLISSLNTTEKLI